MAMFNNYPATYQPYYPATYQPVGVPSQNTSQQSQNSGIIWVQGEAGAKSYLVAPNTTVQLWDSENQVIYLKSADASGMPSIKTLDYTIRDAQANSKATEGNSHNFISKDRFNALESQLEALKQDVDKLTKKINRRVDDE